jgi:hypothetical protein
MTVVVALKASEGLVLGSDSAVSLRAAEGGILNVFEYGDKLSPIKDYPIGTLTWGIGSVGDRPIKSLISEFSDGLESFLRVTTSYATPKYTVQEIAQKLHTFMKEKYAQAGEQSVLGMYIGGYSEGRFFPEEYEFGIPGSDEVTRIFPDRDGKPAFGFIWRGTPAPITRLIKGYDIRTPKIFKGDTPLTDEEKKALDRLNYIIPIGSMPLQDGIDLVKFLVNTAIGISRFGLGAPVCGGEIDIAVVTRDGFRWVKKKELKG